MHDPCFCQPRQPLVMPSLLALVMKGLDAQTSSVSICAQFAGTGGAFGKSQVTDTIGAKIVAMSGTCDYVDMDIPGTVQKGGHMLLRGALLLDVQACSCGRVHRCTCIFRIYVYIYIVQFLYIYIYACMCAQCVVNVVQAGGELNAC